MNKQEKILSVEELYNRYRETKIDKNEIDVRKDGYHTFHKDCNTDLVLPNKKNIPDHNIFKAISKFRNDHTGMLYCPSCDKIYTYFIEY